MEGSTICGRVLDEDLSWREANSLYLSYQGKRRGKGALKGTLSLIRQGNENFIDVDTKVSLGPSHSETSIESRKHAS